MKLLQSISKNLHFCFLLKPALQKRQAFLLGETFRKLRILGAAKKLFLVLDRYKK